MKRSWKRALVLLLAMALVVGMFPVTAEAAPKSKKKQVVSVSITKPDTKTLVLKKGKTYTIKTKVTVKNKASKKVTYSSSKKKVATINSKGKIKALKNGTTTITVKSKANSKKKATLKVIVGTPVKKVVLNKKKATLTEGDSLSLKATVSPKKPSVKKLSFSSSNKSVATVNSKGVVTAKKAGTVTITAKATDGSGKKATCKITIKEKQTTPPDQPVTPIAPVENEYKLVWSDEFEGTELNRDDWNVELHEPGWVNEELQEYVDSEENIYLEDGKLVLKPVKTVRENEVSYTSGRVNTQNKHNFTYGKFEVRAKVPEGKGYLPAFWLMAADENVYGQWPRCGEIDIMEILGDATNTLHGTIHYGHNSTSGHKESKGTYVLENGAFSDDFHTYSCEWEPGKITWYVDGVKYYEENKWYTAMSDGTGKLTYPAPFDQPFYIILNLAVGGNWVGNPDETTDFENQTYEIDYVKVYQKDNYDEDVTEPVEEDVVIREPDEAGNYLINGDFEQAEDLVAEDNWQFKTASNGVATASITDNSEVAEPIDGKSVIIETTNDGDIDYSVQLVQNDVPLMAGGIYELSFDAYAVDERPMKVNSKSENNGWYAYLDETIDLTTEKQTYTYEFDMIHADDAACTVEFNLGNFDATQTVVIDNVSLKLKEMDEKLRNSIINPAKAVRADGNYIYNGEFQEGTKYLGYWTVQKGADVSVTSLADGRKLKVVVPANGKVTISQEDVPVLSAENYALSLDAKVPANASVDISFDGATYTVPASTDGSWSQKFTTTSDTAKRDITFTFKGAGTYYIDNVRMAEDAMIANGSFNAGFSGYEPYVYSNDYASYNVDSMSYDNAAAFDINQTGSEAWYIQLKQNGIALEKDKWYQLSLDAKSTVDRKLMFAIQRDGTNDDDWFPYSGESIVDLTSDWQTFDLTFQMTKDTDLKSVLSISMGAVGGVAVDTKHSVYIDNIVLVETEAPGLDPKPYDVNLFNNPEFANDGEGWEKTIKAGEISTAENSITFDIEDVGTNDYDVQLKQMGIQLEKGQTYEVSFTALSTVARQMSASVMSAGYDYYGGASISLEENIEQDVSFEFTMAKDDIGAGLFVSMGQFGNTPASTITLSNFSVMKIQKAVTEVTPIEPGVNQLDMNSMANSSYGGKQTMTVSGNSIVYNIEDVGTEDSHIQLKQENITLEKGQTYEVSFKASSTETRDIKVAFMTSTWAWYGGSQVTLNKDAEDDTVSFRFTVSQDLETTDGIIFQVSMGQMFDESQTPKVEKETPPSTITLSDFSLIKLESE